ncbi:Uncharacterised protein [Fusobacterium necrogenes]|uniref:Uncharacterized protein n=1 Tax=Fusobacterium necrogenes TaxID=858 RepID=A0A377H050_9FUSO|nr:hypothetical protein [Fusobacterium necrogenes]STO32171.1 Uncharacterised protein [Fusobacterium necrogenes]
MKKIVGFIAVVVLILGIFLGYKVVYKASPRDFITKETKIIYANEGISSKNFTLLLELFDKEKVSGLNSEISNLKYISKFYVFSDKEFYAINEKSFTVVVDTGYWYFFLLKNLGRYFELKDDLYVLKREYKDKYLPKLKTDLFMKNYKGLFIFSLGEKNLKDFMVKDKKYLYNKEIEERLDLQRDNLLGTFIYNNTEVEFYGLDYLINSVDIKDGKLISDIELVLDKEKNEIFKNNKNERELLKYFGKNNIYFSVNDFSKLDKLLFNPFVTGVNIDIKSILILWKNLLGIDIEKILKEIDGEVLYRVDENSFMIKIKDEAPEIEKVLKMLGDENSAFYIGRKIEKKDGIVIIGDSKFDERTKVVALSDETFVYGKLESFEFMGFEGVEATIHGEDQNVKIKLIIPVEEFKKMVIRRQI